MVRGTRVNVGEQVVDAVGGEVAGDEAEDGEDQGFLQE